MKFGILFLVFGLFLHTSWGQTCPGTPGQVTWRYWLNMPENNGTDTSALFSDPRYPNHPDGSQVLASMQTPLNFTEYYASSIRAFLRPTVTSAYRFNVTGDDKAVVYLSLTPNESNKRLIAEVVSWTNRTEHTKSPQQTSGWFNLEAGKDYYIEMIQLEGNGGDHASLFWQRPNETQWQVIDFRSLVDVGCLPSCPVAGTPCDDGDPATVQDAQDGNCQCHGISVKPTTCIGERGGVQVYYYDQIPGSYVENDLLNSPKFPLVPDRREYLTSLIGPRQPYSRDQYGSLVQGYITVPRSGNYEFNLTGDNQTMFFLSKNHDPAFLQTHQLIVMNGLGEYQHNQSRLQSTAPLRLEKGQYYYFEILHKENTSRDYFQLFWRSTHFQSNHWKRVPGFYLFDYTCEVACVPAGTPCDDGNPRTNNDQFNTQCECVGTPCSGPDCLDPRVSYQPFESCLVKDNLLPIAEEQWLSCQPTSNPNPARGTSSHWIEYQFEQRLEVGQSRIWNYNVENQTNKGFRQVWVDFSEDGVSWQTLGQFTWPEAPGTTDYAGFTGPDFQKRKIKKILITAISSYGEATCAGFGKMTWEATVCEPFGTPCNDGDPLTIQDQYNDNCVCSGVPIDCRTEFVNLTSEPLEQRQIQAIQTIQSNSKVTVDNSIQFIAGNTIVLLPGFEAHSGSVFSATIKQCLQQAISQELAKGHLTYLDQEANHKQVVYQVPKPGKVELQLEDSLGNVVQTLFRGVQNQQKTYTKWIPTQKLGEGPYTLVLRGIDWEVRQPFETSR